MNRVKTWLVLSVIASFFASPLMGKQNWFATEKNPLWPDSQDRVAFYEAVKKGDVASVKKIVEAFPLAPLLTDFVQDKDKKGVFPICVAAENGSVDVLKYMVQKRPQLLRVACQNEERTLFSVAVENKQWDTAALLVSLNAPLWPHIFAETAMQIKDVVGLKKIIPALLNIGKVSASERVFLDYGKQADPFYIAALHKNSHFVTILRDEMKKQNQEVIAKFKFITCPPPGPYYTLHGYTSEELETIKEKENSTEARFLRERGVPLYVSIEYDARDCD